MPRWQRAPSPSRSTWVLAPSSGTNARWSSGWKTAWHPDDPARWGPKYQQNSPKAGHSRVLCLFLCLPEIVCGAKSFRAFPFVRSRRALPRSSAVLHRLMGVLGNVLGNFRRNHPEVVQDCVRASKNR